MDRRTFIKSISLAGIGAIALKAGLPLTRSLSVYVQEPITGAKCSRAAAKHFRHKFYPSQLDATKHTPHPGCRFATARKDITVPIGINLESLFAGRKDLDLRVKSDIKHLAQLDCNVLDIEQQLF
ncbi:MAG: hypothetical protein AB7T27_06165 [Kiritimatiellia bacterium]